MTHAQSDTSPDGAANASSGGNTIERELAAEQAHVDLVYARLAEATRSAQRVARAGLSLYQSDRSSFVREEDGTSLHSRLRGGWRCWMPSRKGWSLAGWTGLTARCVTSAGSGFVTPTMSP